MPGTKERAETALRGIIPGGYTRKLAMYVVLQFMQLGEYTYDIAQVCPDHMYATMWKAYHVKRVRSRSEYSYVELCEATARGLAQTHEPRTFRDIDKLPAHVVGCFHFRTSRHRYCRYRSPKIVAILFQYCCKRRHKRMAKTPAKKAKSPAKRAGANTEGDDAGPSPTKRPKPTYELP